MEKEEPFVAYFKNESESNKGNNMEKEEPCVAYFKSESESNKGTNIEKEEPFVAPFQNESESNNATNMEKEEPFVARFQNESDDKMISQIDLEYMYAGYHSELEEPKTDKAEPLPNEIKIDKGQDTTVLDGAIYEIGGGETHPCRSFFPKSSSNAITRL